MSRKSYRVDVLPITRTPTRREIEWAEQRRAAGGAVDGERGLFLMNGGRDALGGHRALGDPIHARAGAAGIARIGAAEARREDPYAYMGYQAVRDHIDRLDDERGLGMSDVEVSRLAQERHNAALERRKKFDRYVGDPRYQPGAGASKVDFMWDRPLEWDEQAAVPGAVRRGPRPQDGRGKTKSARSRTAQRAKTFDKVTRQDAKGGRTSRADVLGGSTFRKEWEDGSYITRSEGNGSYQWYNKDGSLRGEAKDFREIGGGGRVFFGDLSTGEGKVTIGGDQRNETLVRNFKDADGTASYDTYQLRNGKEYKGASRTFTYGGGGKLQDATHTIRADYGGDNQVEFTSKSLLPGASGQPAGTVAASAVRGPDGQTRGTAAFLKNARQGMTTETDRQRQDYLLNQSGEVAKYLDKQRGVDLAGAEKALDAAAGRVGRGGAGRAGEDALRIAKGAYADQYARSRANLDIARFGSGFGDYLDMGRAAATARSGQTMARARGWRGGETTIMMGGPNGPVFAGGDSSAIAAVLGRPVSANVALDGENVFSRIAQRWSRQQRKKLAGQADDRGGSTMEFPAWAGRAPGTGTRRPIHARRIEEQTVRRIDQLETADEMMRRLVSDSPERSWFGRGR